MIVGKPYDKEFFNCATTVCEYFRENNIGDLPNGDLEEYTLNGLLWIKNNFKKADVIEKHCLLLSRNFDGSLHVAVFDGDKVIHNTSGNGSVIREPLSRYLDTNKNIKVYKWQHLD
jgi:hypothetical protein